VTRQLVVEVVGDNSKLTKSLDQAGGRAESFGGKLKNVGKGMAIGAGVGAFNLLTGAISMGISKLGEAKQAYLDDVASQDMLAAAYKRKGVAQATALDAIEKQISANQKLGVSDSEQRDGIAAFINKTKDSTVSLALNQAAMDLAAATGKTYAEAQAEVLAGVSGKTKALEKDGVQVNKNMSAEEMAAAITAKYGGAQAALAETEVGKVAVSHEKVGEAMEKVGMVVAKVSGVVLPILADAFSTVVDVLGEVWSAIQPVVEAVAKQLEPVFKAVGPVAQAIFGAIGSAIKALQPVFKVVFDVIGAYIGVWVKVLSAAFGVVSRVVSAIGPVFSAIAGVVGKVFGGIVSTVKGAFNMVIGAINAIIGAINSIQIHFGGGPGGIGKFDWDGFNIKKLPYLHQGGIVPGIPGSDVPAILQAGETVLPAGRGSGVTVYIYGNVYGSGGIDELSDQIALRLRLAGA
jgi:hypothetical protein